jgi:4-aminobutyrate aminotransferase
LKVPDIKDVPPGKRGKKVVQRDKRILATTTKTSEVVAERARGSLVWDMDGSLYIDFTSGIGVVNVGHCHPAVTDAITKQVNRLMHFAGTDFYYDIQVSLAERLAKLTPGKSAKKVFYTNSGAESVEAAIKISKWSTKRGRFIAFIGAFHGRTMGALAMTASKIQHQERFFSTMPGVDHVPYAYCYRCPYKLEYPSCGVWCADAIQELYLDKFVPPKDVAALFYEPVQGEGGYVVPPPEFPKKVSKICKKHGILFVDDEVQAGFGRTGKMFGIEHYDVVPDIVCLAKGMGSGMPVGAVILDARLDFGVQGAHSNTYGGNLVACATTMATLDVIEKERLISRSERMGKRLRARLDEMKEDYPIMGDNRGLGLMQATEFVKDPKSKSPAPGIAAYVVQESLKKGLILLPCGKSGVRYIPPLNIEKEHLDKGLDVLSDAIKKAGKIKKK